MFKGYFCALITPFRNGKIDEPAFQALVETQIAAGVHGLVPCGTTGESPALSDAEHDRVIELCLEVAKGRVPVVPGTGTNNTAESIERARHAKRVGADAALVVTPYYNKPTQEGLFQHFKAINDAVEIPIIIYNIPPRSVIDMSVETMARLAALPNIVGVKDATADLGRVTRTRRAMSERFYQMSGEDGTALAFFAHGGHGCISVTANVAPRQCVEFFDAWEKGDARTALALHDRLAPLHDALFVETSPAPVKYAASLLGLCTDEVRLPMVPIGAASRGKVEQAMRSAGVLN